MAEDFEIVDGVYKSPKKYPGGLFLRCTSVASLGSLESVGGFLDLENTSVTSLGSLESAGVSIYTDSSKHYSVQDLKVLVQEIEESSISALVERLPIEKDPFLKRVIQEALHG